MKIFYTCDAITGNCIEPCPISKDAHVGSVCCKQECPHCYGRSLEFNDWALFPTNSAKPFVFREIKYVNCAGLHENKPWYMSVYCILYKYIYKYILNLIDNIQRKI